jgi:DNA-binding MarR family transcriptional regulator
MGKKENIDSIIRLMQNLMLSTKAHDPHPWLHLELTREQMRVIFLLFFKDRASPGEVAGSFGVPKANVTSVIDRLVGKGLVSRQENPQDRRGYILSLTEEGKSQVERLWEVRIARFKRVLDRMTEEALDSVRCGLEALLAALKEEGERNGYNQGR